MSDCKQINIGKDFSEHPIGRYRSDGESSGEVFCEDFLLPTLHQLKSGERLEIVLDDRVEGYGSSFLSEAFAGAVRKGYVSSKELLNILEFKYSDPDFEFFADKIRQYIKETKPRSSGR